MFNLLRKVVLNSINSLVPDSELQIVELISSLTKDYPVISILDIGGGSGEIWKNRTLLKLINDGKLV